MNPYEQLKYLIDVIIESPSIKLTKVTFFHKMS